jgi:plasmid replication initiation protein
MIPTKANIAKYNELERAKKRKPKVHQKIANTFIENAISKSNLSALKTIYFLSTVLSDVEMSNLLDEKIIGLKIDKKEMLRFTELTVDTIIKTTKQMQETSITFFDEEKGIIEGMSLLPRYKFVPNKNIVEIDLYVRIAKMIIDVKKNYTPINIKDLMHIKNKHSLRLLALLCRIANYDKDVPKRKKMTLEELSSFFGVNYENWGEFERKIIKPVKEELDNNSKISFIYEADYKNLGKGRPSFSHITIDLLERKNYQQKLL